MRRWISRNFRKQSWMKSRTAMLRWPGKRLRICAAADLIVERPRWKRTRRSGEGELASDDAAASVHAEFYRMGSIPHSRPKGRTLFLRLKASRACIQHVTKDQHYGNQIPR